MLGPTRERTVVFPPDVGGFEYWAREGLPVESADGHVHREVDPLTAPVVASPGVISCDC